MHAFYIKHQAEQNRTEDRVLVVVCTRFCVYLRLGMGPPHNLQHQAPPHYVRNSCILNIFIETISIYILGLRRTTHLIDAIQKYYHYSRAHACVCVCVGWCVRLGTGFSGSSIVSNRIFANSNAVDIIWFDVWNSSRIQSARAHCGPRVCRFGHDSRNYDATI